MSSSTRLLLPTLRRLHGSSAVVQCRTFANLTHYTTRSLVSSTSNTIQYNRSTPSVCSSGTGSTLLRQNNIFNQTRSVVSWLQDKFTERQTTKKAAKIIDQISLMANSPKWTLKHMADEVDETLNAWTAKIPGASKSVEMQRAKETQVMVKAMMAHLGDKVTLNDIEKLDRKQKLKLVIACKKPMDEVDHMLSTFKQMDIMHRILRMRKENGKELPTDEEGLKMVMMSDSIKVMTRDEKKEMKEMYQESMKNKMAD